ncbi:MAG: phosphohydrolase [Aureispira sp.]|nr:phosphohydrolase [Aureispira sp.]
MTPHQAEIGKDYERYRNHVYRVFNYAWYLLEYDEDSEEKLAIAAVYHDIGIWTDKTFDYLDPSVHKMRAYLQSIGQENWIDEIRMMILLHHKISSYRGHIYHAIVESFRQADTLDLLFGFKRFGIPKTLIKQINKQFPSLGFRRMLLKMTGKRFLRHPLNPLPMFKR